MVAARSWGSRGNGELEVYWVQTSAGEDEVSPRDGW